MLDHDFFLSHHKPVPHGVPGHGPCQENPGVEIEGDTKRYERDPGSIHGMAKPPEGTGGAESIFCPPVPERIHAPKKKD